MLGFLARARCILLVSAVHRSISGLRAVADGKALNSRGACCDWSSRSLSVLPSGAPTITCAARSITNIDLNILCALDESQWSKSLTIDALSRLFSTRASIIITVGLACVLRSTPRSFLSSLSPTTYALRCLVQHTAREYTRRALVSGA